MIHCMLYRYISTILNNIETWCGQSTVESKMMAFSILNNLKRVQKTFLISK